MKQKLFINSFRISCVKIGICAFALLFILTACKPKKIVGDVVELVVEKTGKKAGNTFSKEFLEKCRKLDFSPELLEKIEKDIAGFPKLAEELSKHPSWVKAYQRMEHLPLNFRTDAKLLSWLDYVDKMPQTFQKDMRKLSFEVDELGQTLKIGNGKEVYGTYSKGIMKCKAGVNGGEVHRVPSNILLNAPLIPNTLYKVDAFVYEIDELGRVKEVRSLIPLQLRDRGRNIRAQSWVNATRDGVLREESRQSDVAGHIIAQRFNGPSELINFFPQLPALNGGEWKALENEFASLISKKSKVLPQYRLIYGSDGKRPISLEVIYTVDGGSPIRKIFSNV